MPRSILTDDYVRTQCRRSKTDPIEVRKQFISGKMSQSKYDQRMVKSMKKRFPQLYHRVMNPALEHGIPSRRTGELDDRYEYLDAEGMYEDLFEDAMSVSSIDGTVFEDAMSVYSDDGTEFFDVEDIEIEEDKFYDTTEAPGRRRTYKEMDQYDRAEYFDSTSGIGSAEDEAYQSNLGTLPKRGRTTPLRYGYDEHITERRREINRRRFDLAPSPARRNTGPT